MLPGKEHYSARLTESNYYSFTRKIQQLVRRLVNYILYIYMNHFIIYSSHSKNYMWNCYEKCFINWILETQSIRDTRPGLKYSLSKKKIKKYLYITV